MSVNKQFHILVSDREHLDLVLAASNAGFSDVNDWARALISAELERPSAAPLPASGRRHVPITVTLPRAFQSLLERRSGGNMSGWMRSVILGKAGAK